MRLEAVSKCLSEVGLKLKPSKCKIFEDKLGYLGYVASSRGGILVWINIQCKSQQCASVNEPTYDIYVFQLYKEDCGIFRKCWVVGP